MFSRRLLTNIATLYIATLTTAHAELVRASGTASGTSAAIQAIVASPASASGSESPSTSLTSSTDAPSPAPPQGGPADDIAAIVTCPTDTTGASYAGDAAYIGQGPKAAPLRGNVGCVDMGPLSTRPTAEIAGETLDAVNIYGAMEAGFDNTQPGTSCLGNQTLDAGCDTNLAEAVMSEMCLPSVLESLLDYCGGHAVRRMRSRQCVRERQCERETVCERDRETVCERDRETERSRDRETERQRDSV